MLLEKVVHKNNLFITFQTLTASIHVEEGLFVAIDVGFPNFKKRPRHFFCFLLRVKAIIIDVHFDDLSRLLGLLKSLLNS